MRSRRSALAGALALVLALTLAACDRPGAGSGGAADPPRVALLHPGPISDGSWNAGAYEGLQRIERELGARVSHTQTSSPSEFERAFRDYASHGYDLVFGHGFEFQDAAAAVAQDFPTTVFVVSSGRVSAANVASLDLRLGEATYLAGILAASMSKSHRAGCVGGIKLPVIEATFAGFEAGAKSVDPDFVVATAYTGSFEDVAASRAAADAMIAQGADVLIHNADAAGLGVIQAARAKGVWAIGTNSDQSPVAPETVLASAVISIPEAFLEVAREVFEHRFAGRVIREGLANGVVRLVLNPRLADRIPAEVKARVAAAEKKIVSGGLRVEP